MEDILFRQVFKDHVTGDFSHFTEWGIDYPSKGINSYPSSSNHAKCVGHDRFTGLTDKNGVKIFLNSDIVETKFVRHVDTFKECSWTSINPDGTREFKKSEKLPCVLIIRLPSKGIEFYNKEFDLYTPAWVKSKDDIADLEIIGNTHYK